MIPHECHKLFNLYFVLTGLDLLESLDSVAIDKEAIIEYIYANQCINRDSPDDKSNDKINYGFLGGPFLGFTNKDEYKIEDLEKNPYYTGNLVYTFPALCCLIMLGDDLSRVDKKGISKLLKKLQLENGW